VTAGAARYAGTMGYSDGGGLTAAERARREQVRLAAAEPIKAGRLGPAGSVPDAGPDRRAGAGAFQVDYTLAGLDVLPHRIGRRPTLAPGSAAPERTFTGSVLALGPE